MESEIYARDKKKGEGAKRNREGRRRTKKEEEKDEIKEKYGAGWMDLSRDASFHPSLKYASTYPPAPLESPIRFSNFPRAVSTKIYARHRLAP